jgi:soluble lytic murein transglycosylase-like protein
MFLNMTQAHWCEVHSSVHQAVIRYGLSETLGYKKAMSTMLGLIQKESSFQSDAIGKAGEIGLAQIKPATGRFICGLDDKALLNINSNINCSVKYLNLLLGKDYFDNDLNMALIAYNQGWGNVKKGLFEPKHARYAKLIVEEYSPRFN